MRGEDLAADGVDLPEMSSGISSCERTPVVGIKLTTSLDFWPAGCRGLAPAKPEFRFVASLLSSRLLDRHIDGESPLDYYVVHGCR